MKQDQVHTLNYCAHAIEDMRELAMILSRQAPNSARVLNRLILMLQSSVKFILPNCCNLVETDELRQAHLDLLRLPFPCVAFEAPWDMVEAGPAYMGEFKQTLATKRIALCWDSREFEPMPGLNRYFDLFEDGGVFVLPIYWGPEHKTWTVALGGVFIPYKNVLTMRNFETALPATRIAITAKFGAGHAHAKSMQFKAEPFPVLPEFFEQAIATYGSRDKANARIMIDAHDETMVLIQACSVINCANVATTDISASTVLNKKRQASGKQPFFSYKVLQLSDVCKGAGRAGPGSHHASARMHLRRGHLRHLEHKVVWVRPSIVNADSTRGVVQKDYGLVSERSGLARPVIL